FFMAMSLLPFAVLRRREAIGSRKIVAVLGGVIATCAAIGIALVGPGEILRQALIQTGNNLHHLTRLSELRRTREDEWRSAVAAAAVASVRERVGAASIDMVTWQQGMILLNGLNYSPRPMFQSHLASTPALARLNEAYFLGPDAPDFVLFQLDNSD